MIQRLIKNFIFDERIRQGLVFSDPTKIRLNTEDKRDPRIQLKANTAGQFPTDADIFVETPITTPNALQKWLKFEALVTEDKETMTVPAGTSLGFKIKTTAGNRYWNGSAWAPAALSNWNTEAEINANLDTFPIATIGDKGLGVVINLVTTDKTVTPKVKEAKFLGQFDIDVLDDLVYDGVIRKLNSTFRSSSVLRFPATGSISSIDLVTVLENKGYNVVAIRAVYDLTDDPLKLTNLFDSYTPGAIRPDGFTNDPGTVTFNTTISSGNTVSIQFEYVPEFYIRSGQDFFEIPTFPSIIFENIISIDDRFTIRDSNSAGQDFIREKSSLSAVEQRGARQQTIRFEYAVFTNRQLDQMRLVNDINAFWAREKSVRTFGLDCTYSLNIVEQVNTARNQRAVDDTDTNVAQGSFDVLGVLFHDKPATDQPLVGDGQLSIDVNLIEPVG